MTFEGHLGSKKINHSKGNIWLPIWLLLTPSLHLVPFSRYSTSKFLGFDLDLWPLKVIWGEKNCIQFERPYMTSYLTAMDTLLSISLSRKVFEIFDFKVFRVWPWPLIPEGHLGSKKFISFERPNMTFYLTSMDTISLSHTVIEIFDLKVFRVWPRPLTPKCHLGLKKFIPFERPYMTSYLTSMDTISLSRNVFELFDFNFLGFDLDLWPLKVIWGQKCLYYSKGHIWLPIWLL